MHWAYYPDGKLKSRSDDGVPPGDHVVVIDNSDADATKATGTWATAGTEGDSDHKGYDYRTHAGGNSTDSFAWSADIPADGTYEVFAAVLSPRYGAVAVCRWTIPPSSRCQETSRQPAAVTCWARSGGEGQVWMDSAR